MPNNHVILILVRDANLNTTELKFNIKGEILSNPLLSKDHMKGKKLIHCKSYDNFMAKNIKILFPPNSLYENLDFEFNTYPQKKGYYSPIYEIHNIYTPIHQAITLQITPVKLPERWKEKAVIVNIDKNRNIDGTGGYKGNFVEAQIRSFGTYAVALDTTAPIIKPLFNGRKDFSNEQRIVFRISDDLTGISKYQGYIDKKWILLEYDLKSDLFFYEFDSSRMEFGKNHSIDLYISDEKNNTSEYHYEFYK